MFESNDMRALQISQGSLDIFLSQILWLALIRYLGRWKSAAGIDSR
jgi:hypothetical protein